MAANPLGFCLPGLKLGEVFILLDGLDELPDILVSVLSVLDELWLPYVAVHTIIAFSSASLVDSSSSLLSPVNGIERICDALCGQITQKLFEFRFMAPAGRRFVLNSPP